MAFKSNDGKLFTNKPVARAHDARQSAARKISNDAPVRQAPPMHSEVGTVTCPACGAKFTPDADEHDQMTPPNTDDGSGMLGV